MPHIKTYTSSNVEYLVHEIVSIHGFSELSKSYKQHAGHNESFQYLTDIYTIITLRDNYYLDVGKCNYF